MRQVTIPKTLDVDHLEGLERLITAAKWERAAIVYAFTYEGNKQRKGLDGKYTIEEFAALGVSGLRATETVRRYRSAWKMAGTNDRLLPGDKVKLPTGPFPSYVEAIRAAGNRQRRKRDIPWRERIVNQAQKTLERVAKVPLDDDDIAAVEEAWKVYDSALDVIERRRDSGTLATRLPGYSKFVDYLQVDGGWLTTAAIGDRFEMTTEATKRELYRLRSKGLVEKDGGKWRAV